MYGEIANFGLRIANLKARMRDAEDRLQTTIANFELRIANLGRAENSEFRIQKTELRVCFSYLLNSGRWLLTPDYDNCGFRIATHSLRGEQVLMGSTLINFIK